MFSSADALGFLVDLSPPGCSHSLEGPRAIAASLGKASDRHAREVDSLWVDDCPSVDRSRCRGLACAGPRLDSGPTGTRAAGCDEHHCRRTPRRRSTRELSVVQFAPYFTDDGADAGKDAQIGRANSANQTGGVASLLRARGYGGSVRGVSVPRICDGCVAAHGRADLARGDSYGSAFWLGSCLSGP